MFFHSWIYSIEVGLSGFLLTISFLRFIHTNYQSRRSKNKLTFIPLKLIGTFFLWNFCFALALPLIPSSHNYFEIGGKIGGNILSTIALTFQLFEFHLILKMVSFQHSIPDENAIMLNRALFHQKENRLKYLYIALGTVYLVA